MPGCILCDNVSSSFFGAKNGWKLYRCTRCGVIFVHPMPADTAAIYSHAYFHGGNEEFGYVDYEADKEPMKNTFLELLSRITKYQAAKGRLLDVGAANGFFMRLAQQQGWLTEGIEISDEAAQEGRSRGQKIYTGTLETAALSPASFDALTLWDVLEHVQNPNETIRAAARLLKAGGILALNTPDMGSWMARLMGIRWHLVIPPEHLVYFNASNLRNLLQKYGFEVLETGRIGKRFTLQYVVQILSRWQKFSLWTRLAETLRRNRAGQWGVSINLFDNIFMVARKSG